MYVSAFSHSPSTHSPQFSSHQSSHSGSGITYGYPIASSISPESLASQHSMHSGFSSPSFSPYSHGVQNFVNPHRTAITYGFNPLGWSHGHPSSYSTSHSMSSFSPFSSSSSWVSSPFSSSGITQPRVDIAETNSDIVVTAELHNINSNDLYLTVTDDSLSISCNSFSGGSHTSIHRTVALPTSVRSERAEASYSNGILEARLPKSDVTTRRRIRVNPSSSN